MISQINFKLKRILCEISFHFIINQVIKLVSLHFITLKNIKYKLFDSLESLTSIKPEQMQNAEFYSTFLHRNDKKCFVKERK